MQSTSDSSIIPIYIVNVHPMYIDNSIVWDVFYLTKESKELYCLRIYNIKLSFLVARFPAMNITQFIEYMKFENCSFGNSNSKAILEITSKVGLIGLNGPITIL